MLGGMEHLHAPTTVDDEARLRRAGLRVTVPRMAVLSVVGGLDRPSVEEITGAARGSARCPRRPSMTYWGLSKRSGL